MEHPHGGQPVLHVGEPLDRAQAAMVLVHGRGASARDILMVGEELMSPGWAYIAPQAQGGTWYPNAFTAPLDSNEPWLGSALRVLSELVATIEATIPLRRLILLGFSQGACLTLEFAASNARRFGGIVGLSGGLIGPDTGPRDYPGSLDGTPVFLGCSDVDPHIPKERVQHAADVLGRLGGVVTVRLYPGMGHAINQDELDFVRSMAAAVLPPASVVPGQD
jgi:phospholipase/carboxylesterase